ncbi:DUF2975 domain-containing protein [Kineococcus sp. T13]|uniref:DUF2975 domain-containing protein n=1 Tax=Kineococcus vitellinus TaxID=2696565 RepID=UPI001411DF35|nr:DUF2975 domain-containing protein [Kineococcus vitellinus]NAZ76328.1 DUF2975 domain-containing protein [Kineococcus vitellinus]
MSPSRWAVALLRASLVVLFAVLVLLQVFSLPGQFRHMAEQSPQDAHLRWPLTALSVYWVLCAQVVLVCTWRLLGLVRADRIFSRASLAWVDAVVGAVAAAWVVLAGVFLYAGVRSSGPGNLLLLFLLLVGLAVVGLVVLVLRALLRQATALRTDMDAVI